MHFPWWLVLVITVFLNNWALGGSPGWKMFVQSYSAAMRSLGLSQQANFKLFLNMSLCRCQLYSLQFVAGVTTTCMLLQCHPTLSTVQPSKPNTVRHFIVTVVLFCVCKWEVFHLYRAYCHPLGQQISILLFLFAVQIFSLISLFA